MSDDLSGVSFESVTSEGAEGTVSGDHREYNDATMGETIGLIVAYALGAVLVFVFCEIGVVPSP